MCRRFEPAPDHFSLTPAFLRFFYVLDRWIECSKVRIFTVLQIRKIVEIKLNALLRKDRIDGGREVQVDGF